MREQIWLLLAVSILATGAAASDAANCATPELSQDVTIPVSLGTLDSFVVKNQKGFTEATLVFTGSSSSKINTIFALVELFSGSDRLATLPLNAARKGGDDHNFPIALSPLQKYEVQPLVEPGSVVHLYGYSPRAMTICPSKAVLSYFVFSYSDGHLLDRSLANWYSDAVPYTVPNAPGRLLRGSPIRSLITIGVDTEGRVQIVDAEGLNQQQRSDLQTTMESWRFLPAIDAGQKVATNIRVLIESENCSHFPYPPDRKSVWLGIAICPRGGPSVDQEVYVGGFLQ